jgi:diguanylate cyclase (GGDEF)-like protein
MTSPLRHVRLPNRQARPQRPAPHLASWGIAALLVLLGGLTGSALWARSVGRADSQKAHSAFLTSANATAAALTTALQHEEDLVVAARVYLGGDSEGPNETERGFKRWARSIEALARYPEVTGGGFVQLVPRAQLPAFAAKQVAEPASGVASGDAFQLVPPGQRPFYCLLALSFARREGSLTAPPGLDYCAEPKLRLKLLQARDSGRNEYVSYTSRGTVELTVDTPLYTGQGIPATTAQRRARFRGVFGTTISPQVILAAARRGREDTAIVLNSPDRSQAAFRSGLVVANSQRTTRRLPDAWTMEASAPAVGTGLLAYPTSLIILIGGIAFSTLLSLLMYVLGTGRARAFVMVDEKTAEITHQALHDSLTGLPNRELVLDRAERILAKARREPRVMAAALFVDIDRFKYVNDSFGHAAGDRVLIVTAERLQSAMRDQDTVGRLGGDEFVVLLESNAHEAPPEAIAERLIQVLRQPVELADGRTVRASASVGIAIGSRPTAEQLLQDADLALYAAKAGGKDRAVLFEANMKSAASARLKLELDLSRALEQEQFFLLYQPIVALSSGRVAGVEALLRWHHPDRGVVSPAEFIPLAEEAGRILPIGRWVLSEACRQASIWQEQGHEIGMSVNVSARQLDSDQLVEDVRRALAQSAIEPASLTLEVTETALMDDAEAAAKRLKHIKRSGVRVAIDDFGTGSSSLAYLRQFDVDVIKVDQSFVGAMSDSAEAVAIVHTLIELSTLLGIDTVAEGIEDERQLALLREEGCDYGQGFLFAHPLDAADLEAFLADRERHAGKALSPLKLALPIGTDGTNPG